MEEMQGQSMREEAWSFHTLSGWVTLPAPQCVHQTQTSLSLNVQEFLQSLIFKLLPPRFLEFGKREWKFHPSNC